MGDRHRRSDRAARWRVVALVVAVACVGATGWSCVRAWPEVTAGLRSLGWPSTDGELLRASRWREYRPGYGSDEYASWLYLDYAYTVDDGSGVSTRHRGGFFDVTTSANTRKHHRSLVSLGMAREAMRDAPSVRVHYDPADPTRSVLRPGIAYGTTGWLMLVVAFFGCAIWSLRVWFDRRDTAIPPIVGGTAWILLFPVGWFALAGCLGVAWDRILGGVPPVSIVLAYLGLAAAVVLRPRLARTKPVGAALAVFAFGIPLVAAIALGCHVFDGDGRLAYDSTVATPSTDAATGSYRSVRSASP